MVKNICLLGATGSIGMNTVQVVLSRPDLFHINSLSFNEQVVEGELLIRKLSPAYVAVKDAVIAQKLQKKFPRIQFGYGITGLCEAATLNEIDIVLTAVTGSIGLVPTLAAIQAGKDIALANKETLVMGGELVMAAIKKSSSRILPVDSEHAAIFQCLKGESINEIDHLIITASGGSFRDLTRAELDSVTVADALQHPNWAMGRKITIDSATMMNKGLEVIEAHWLFDVNYDKIKVMQHRESIVHSMVVYQDGAIKAQLGPNDMREAIQYALTYPNREPIVSPKEFSLTDIGALHFEKMDLERFPMLSYAYYSGEIGGTLPTVMNAANEIAVSAFLNGQISFLMIERMVYEAINKHKVSSKIDLETLQTVDKETRNTVQSWINKL